MMRYLFKCLLLAGVVGSAALGAAQDPTASGTGQLQKPQNARSATQDTSATSGDQITKPAGAKTATLIGCLSQPDADGHLKLNSMQYRSGIEVVGPNDLPGAAGKKVKLMGKWEAAADAKSGKKFQAASFDVLADKCSVPAETNPVSKQKVRKQK